MGYTGETANPAVLPLIEEAMRRIRKAGKAPGYLSPVEADAKRMLAAGAQFCRGGRRRRPARARRREPAGKIQVMKHEIIVTTKIFPRTQERLDREFTCHKLHEAADRAAFLQGLAPRVRALATFGPAGADAKLMDALPKLEIISNFGVGVDADRPRGGEAAQHHRHQHARRAERLRRRHARWRSR